MPLPPYIKRHPESLDQEYYQTVYAQRPGAVAAPTAGLHFTNPLLEKIEKKGVNLAYVTLHIGVGTFRPVKVEDISRHRMDSEYFEIDVSIPRPVENPVNETNGFPRCGRVDPCLDSRGITCAVRLDIPVTGRPRSQGIH